MLRLFFLLSFLIVAGDSTAQSFDQTDQTRLCTRSDDGNWYLDPEKITKILVGKMLASGSVEVIGAPDGSYSIERINRTRVFNENKDDIEDLFENLEVLRYQVVFSRQATAEERLQNPELEYESAALLYPKDRLISVVCNNIQVAPPDDPSKDQDEEFRVEATMRVRGEVSDLVNDIGPRAVPAIFAFSRDFEGNDATFQSDVAVGLALKGRINDHLKGQLVFYGQLDNFRSSASADSNTVSYSSGLILNAEISSSRLENEMSIVGDYTVDDTFSGRTEVISGRLIYSPIPRIGSGAIFDSLRGGHYFFNRSFAFYTRVGGEMVYSNAIKNGGNPEFDEDNTYFHAGVFAGVTFDWFDANKLIFGSSDNPLQKLQLFARYKWLHGFSGTLDSFYRFETGVTFVIGEKENFGITAEYVNGRLDNTLVPVDLLKVGLSVKF
ncbi:hypothetical protein [Roseibium sp.]|uniref:hypothetical protein n=1 Tax=Roseibium sp. TaxID=1936156 RepID=UPI003BABA325